MALKDWKMSIRAQGIIQWDRNRSNKEIAVTNFENSGKKEWFVIQKRWGADVKNLKAYITRPQALRFAKSYMRRN